MELTRAEKELAEPNIPRGHIFIRATAQGYIGAQSTRSKYPRRSTVRSGYMSLAVFNPATIRGWQGISRCFVLVEGKGGEYNKKYKSRIR